MKIKLLIVQAFVIFMCFIPYSNAIIVGYSANLFFTHDTLADISSRPFGDTMSACEANRQNIIDTQTSLGYILDESRSTPCRAIDERLPELIDPRFVDGLPIGPVCLSCPLLNKDSIKLFYPYQYDEVLNLYYQFGIDKYNYQLMKLEKAYDIESFTRNLYKINQKNQQKRLDK